MINTSKSFCPLQTLQVDVKNIPLMAKVGTLLYHHGLFLWRTEE